MHPIRIGIVAIITGVLILSLVYASIPYSDLVRSIISFGAWILGTGAILGLAVVIPTIPRTVRPLTYTALSGWTATCLAVATLASL